MAHIVTCIYCKQKFDRDKLDFVQVSPRRYAHVECSKAEEGKLSQEETDKQKFEQYVMKLLGESFINARVRKQMNQYIQDYNYTYSGMLKALIYFYEIKGNSIEKANGGIGIIPYVYNDAYNYYYALWCAQQKNADKDIVKYVPVIKEITIPIPKRNLKKRKLFSFLDKEEIDIDGE